MSILLLKTMIHKTGGWMNWQVAGPVCLGLLCFSAHPLDNIFEGNSLPTSHSYMDTPVSAESMNLR